MATDLLVAIAHSVWAGNIRLSSVRELLGSEVATRVYQIGLVHPWSNPKWTRQVR